MSAQDIVLAEENYNKSQETRPCNISALEHEQRMWQRVMVKPVLDKKVVKKK